MHEEHESVAKPPAVTASQTQAERLRRFWPEAFHVARSMRIHAAAARVLTGHEPVNDDEIAALSVIRQSLYCGIVGAVAVICGWLLYFIINAGPHAWWVALFGIVIAYLADWFLRKFRELRDQSRTEAADSAGKPGGGAPVEDPPAGLVFRRFAAFSFAIILVLTADFLREFWRPMFLSVATLAPIGVIFMYHFGCESRSLSMWDTAPDAPHDRGSSIGKRLGTIGGGVLRSAWLGLYAASISAFVRYAASEPVEFWALWGWWTLIGFGLGLFTVGQRFSAVRALAGVATVMALVLVVSAFGVRAGESSPTSTGARPASHWYLWLHWYPLEIAIENSLRSPDLPIRDWNEQLRLIEAAQHHESIGELQISPWGAKLGEWIGCNNSPNASLCRELRQGTRSGMLWSWLIMGCFAIGLALGRHVETSVGHRPDYWTSETRRKERAFLWLFISLLCFGVLLHSCTK